MSRRWQSVIDFIIKLQHTVGRPRSQHEDWRSLGHGATGDTGQAAVKESLTLVLDVRAMVHSKDDCASALEKLGAEIVLGDLLEINTIRAAMEGLDAAYFCWPVEPGLIHATVKFRAGREGSGRIDDHQFIAALGKPRLYE
jgi:hypothetical protein